MMRWIETLAPTFFLLAALAGGCSGSAPPDTSTSMLFGTFNVSQIGADGTTGNPWADAFAVRFDGRGGAFADLDLDGMEETATSYTLDAGRTFHLQDDDTVGVLNRTAEVLLTGKVAWTPEINLGVAIRRASGIGPETLAGTYIACLAGGDLTTGHCWTRRMLLSADGVSSLYWTILEDSDGATGNGQLHYGVLDGEMVVRDTLGGQVRYVGAVRLDGSLLVLARQPEPGDPTSEIWVAARRTYQGREASFRGSYSGYSFGARFSGGVTSCVTSRFELEADGAGNASVMSVMSDGGAAARSWPYTVTAEGRLSLSGEPFGALTADGEIFVGVDADASDQEIAFYMGLRR